MNPADTNPITKPYCTDCKFWEPTGFYTWQREENPKMRECKHRKRCERVYGMATKTGQMQLSDFI
jgi:hypothetical protein